MRRRAFLQRTLAGSLVVVSTALFAAPANAAIGSWNSTSTTTGETSTYSFSGTTTQDATIKGLKATVPSGTSATGAKAVQLNERGGFFTPNASGQAPSNMDLIFRVRMDDWTPSSPQMLASKWTNSSGERAWALQVNTDGSIGYKIGNTGAGIYNLQTAGPLGFTDGETKWLRILYTNSTSADRRYLSAFTSTDGVNWGSSIASGNQATARTTNPLSSEPIRIGHGDGSIGTVSMRGAIYSARFIDTDAGTTFAAVDASDYNTGTSSWSSNGFTWSIATFGSVNGTTVGRDLVASPISGAPVGGRAYLNVAANEILYQFPADTFIVNGTSMALSFNGIVNTPTPGTYSSVLTSQLTSSVVDTFNTNANVFVSPTGVSLATEVAPLLSFSIMPRTLACNGVTPNGASSSSSLDLGRINSGSPRSAAQDVSASANSGHGVLLTLRSSGSLSDGRGNSIAAMPGDGNYGNAQAFPVAGTAAFGYTLGWMGANKWVPPVSSDRSISYNPNPGTTATCVLFQAQTSPATPAGVYGTTVIYTAVPTF